MVSKKEAIPDNLSKIHVITGIDKAASPSVVCFSTAQKVKKLTEAKRRVHQAAANLTW